jgi:TRAP-type uncharacterized transport system substrate-binding protein
MPVELSRWVRISLVMIGAVVAAGAAAYGYRFFTTPIVFTVAVGSADGEAASVMKTIAARLASTKAPVRLKVVDTGTMTAAAKQFADKKADLAIVRADLPGLADARSVVIVAHGVVMLLVPSDSAIDSIAKLKGKTVGVIGSDVNASLIQALDKGYDLTANHVSFKNLDLQEAPKAVASKAVSALVVVAPVTPHYVGMIRALFGHRQPKPIEIEAAGAIAEESPAYESYDLPKGSLRGSPPIPDDDLTMLRVPIYLVANKSVDDDSVTALTRAIIDIRRELVGSTPILSQIGSPSTDKDAFIPLHGGAAIYFNGDEQSLLDKYSNALFYGPWFAGGVLSALLWAWKFIGFGPESDGGARRELSVLAGRVGEASSHDELATIEDEIDAILMRRLAKRESGDEDTADAAALTLLAQRLQHLIDRRRERVSGAPPAATTA